MSTVHSKLWFALVVLLMAFLDLYLFVGKHWTLALLGIYELELARGNIFEAVATMRKLWNDPLTSIGRFIEIEVGNLLKLGLLGVTSIFVFTSTVVFLFLGFRKFVGFATRLRTNPLTF